MKTFSFFLENTFISGQKTKAFLARVIFTIAHTAFHSAHSKQALRGNVVSDHKKNRDGISPLLSLCKYILD